MRGTRQTSTRRMVGAARSLRQRQTTAENVLWEAIRGRQVLGIKFRRQHPVGPFVVDFFADDLGLVIELDGAVHDDPEQIQRDRNREEGLRAAGLSVLRFRNYEVLSDVDRVVAQVAAAIEQARAVVGRASNDNR